jgi:glycerophosphoryl diester phosphodiesterase
MVTHYIHRGLATRKLKENTIAAFKYSFRKGYGIETDIHCTKDNRIICFHDFNLKKKFKLNKKIKNINYKEIRKISLKFNSKVPLLEDLLKLKRKKLPLMIEIKPIFSKKILLSLLNKIKGIKNYCLTSFHEKNLINLSKLGKKLSLGIILPKSTTIKKLKLKSKKKYIKLLVIEKKFLKYPELEKIDIPIFYYTSKNKNTFKKYKNLKNLIFENL